jgi:hypothetical protein
LGLFAGRRETLNEQLAREAGLGPPREHPRPVRGLFAPVFRPLRTRWAEREQRKLMKYAGEHGSLNGQEAAQGREDFRLNAPDTPPPGFG